ncbi:HTTM domain-containing protein [Flavobacterium humi]|uniref:HTTM-like domain-containing protein n=1 Tax=Flavobacterium humi TaxID=2562683 RepID=A0A4Z0L699_9FLAO|nr:HTTM domain-containing protein [Flavobacterium humi]TGD57927.1 hypothetical protein E4635_07915 [Flavobacterium humi]
MRKAAILYTKIENFFFENKGTAEFLVFFRISIGTMVLLHFVSIIPDFDMFFSSKSIVPQDIMSVFHPGWLLTFSKITAFFDSYGITESTVILGTKITFITLCVAIITGFYSRVSAFLLLILQVALLKGSSFFIYGVDFFTSMSLFYLILFPSDADFSLRRFFFKKETKNVSYMPVKRMFQIHISIAYFFSGLDKLLGYNWRNGESIWKAIHLPYANRDFNFDFSWMADHSYILVILGWSTVMIEMLYPVFVWIPKTRKTWMLLTISMHLGIALVLNLYYFSAIMIIWNLANFYFEKESVPVTFPVLKRLFYRKPAPIEV